MKHFAVPGAFLLLIWAIIPASAASNLDFAGRPPWSVLDGFLPGNSDRLTFSYYQSASRPRSILNRSIVFDGRSFSLDEEVETVLDYDVYDFVYQYDLFDLENVLSGFSGGVVGQVKLVDGQTAMPGPDKPTGIDFSAPIPLVGMNLHMDILGGLLAGRVRATGMGYSHGSVFDGQAELSLTPSSFLDIRGGYRFYFIDLETDQVQVKDDRSGPYLGITLGF